MMTQSVKRIAAGMMLMALCSAPAVFAAERGPLSDGEIFVSQKVADDGKVLYRDKKDYSTWNHNSEIVPDGFVGTAFVPDMVDLSGSDKDKDDISQVKKVSQREEKVKAAEKKYHGKDYKKSLVLYAGMNTYRNEGNLAIQKVELLGRLLNVTVAVQDAASASDGSESLYKESVVRIPLKKLPRYGSLRVRFVDMSGHGLQDEDVSLGLGL
jgi:hypothetical protein